MQSLKMLHPVVREICSGQKSETSVHPQPQAITITQMAAGCGLKTTDIIDINGFHCFANNRKTSFSSRKGSGGVAMLVKNHIFDKFSFEGIISVELRHKI